MYQTHKSYTIDEALSKLQKYCAYQDRCHKEVEQKLKQMRMIPEAIEIIIVALIEDNHLNEERVAQKKSATLTETDPWKKKKKLADYLLYRGWESQLVYDKVNVLIN